MGKLVGSRFGKIAKLGSSSNSFVPGVMNDNQLFVFSSLYEKLLPDITSLTVFVLITVVWRYQVKQLKKRKERLMVVTSDVRDVTFVVSLARLGLVTFNGLANAFTICTNQSDLWKSSYKLSWNWYQWWRREMSGFFFLSRANTCQKHNKKGERQGLITQGRKKQNREPNRYTEVPFVSKTFHWHHPFSVYFPTGYSTWKHLQMMKNYGREIRVLL